MASSLSIEYPSSYSFKESLSAPTSPSASISPKAAGRLQTLLDHLQLSPCSSSRSSLTRTARSPHPPLSLVTLVDCAAVSVTAPLSSSPIPLSALSQQSSQFLSPTPCSASAVAASSSTNHEFQTRLLEAGDYHKGYLQILAQLTTVGDITEEQFIQRFNELQRFKDTHFNVVIEDMKKGVIVGVATLLIEKKFIRQCGAAAHIEDVVVDSTYRGKNLGLKVIEECKRIAKEQKCYKVILDCTEQNAPFYEKCGFVKKELQMRCDL